MTSSIEFDLFAPYNNAGLIYPKNKNLETLSSRLTPVAT